MMERSKKLKSLKVNQFLGGGRIKYFVNFYPSNFPFFLVHTFLSHPLPPPKKNRSFAFFLVKDFFFFGLVESLKQGHQGRGRKQRILNLSPSILLLLCLSDRPCGGISLLPIALSHSHKKFFKHIQGGREKSVQKFSLFYIWKKLFSA